MCALSCGSATHISDLNVTVKPLVTVGGALAIMFSRGVCSRRFAADRRERFL